MHLRKGRASSADTSSNRTDGGTGVLSGGPALTFCVSPILFEAAGGLYFDIPSGLSIQSILRLPSHCSMRAHITVSEWATAAQAAFGFNEVVAANIFDALFVLSPKSADSRLENSRLMLSKLQAAGKDSSGSYAQISPQRTVSLPGLMVFLIVQIFCEKHSKTLPCDYNPQHIVTFVKQYLHEIVSALTVTKAGRVTQADLQELRILFREFSNGVEAPFGSNLTFLWPRGEPSVDCAVISQFCRSRVVAAEDIKGATSGTAVFRNLLSGVHIVTQGLPSVRTLHSSVIVQRCQQSTIYLLGPLPNTALVGLANCIIVLGPVSGLLSVVRCENCQIIAPCAGVMVSASRDLELYLCTNTPPILNVTNNYRDVTGDNEVYNSNILFGPYNTFYSSLEEHLSAARVNPKLNLFAENLPSQMIIPPEGLDGNGFCPITIPASPPTTNTVTTRSNPCAMPDVYAQSIASRTEQFKDTSKMLQDAYKKLEESGRKDLADNLKSKVHLAFMDWLVEVGQAKNILQVLHQSSRD